MKKIINGRYSYERALYGTENTIIDSCVFKGKEDGESPLKECKKISVVNSSFALRYPLWHNSNLTIKNSTLEATSRAGIWYCKKVNINESNLLGVKAIRECKNVAIKNCKIDSIEFAWKSNDISIKKSKITAEYAFFDSKKIYLDDVMFNGKYSFQYTNNVEIHDSDINTKDAFWHAKNVVVKDSVIYGEYLGWYSDGLTLINCKIKGTQPLCYCKNLKLINCDMTGCDLAFEYSDVNADIIGKIKSIKNPTSGKINYEKCEEIILKNSLHPLKCVISKK